MNEQTSFEKKMAKLRIPFNPHKVRFAPKQVNYQTNTCTIYPYIRAEDIVERLNSVLGPAGWSWRCHRTADGSVCGSLGVYLPSGELCVKDGYGAANASSILVENVKTDFDQIMRLSATLYAPVIVSDGQGGQRQAPPDKNTIKTRQREIKAQFETVASSVDATKLAETDALKRAAEHWGIGIEFKLKKLWKPASGIPYSYGEIKVSQEQMIQACLDQNEYQRIVAELQKEKEVGSQAVSLPYVQPMPPAQPTTTGDPLPYQQPTTAVDPLPNSNVQIPPAAPLQPPMGTGNTTFNPPPADYQVNYGSNGQPSGDFDSLMAEITG